MSQSGLICPKCSERYGTHLNECPKDHSPLADAAIADALLNRSLGNFLVERILGAGGMGMVFAARHKTLGQQAVVKVLSPDMMRLRDAKTRFLNEAKLASQISHPNIVRIFDFGETPDGLCYMIMDYVAGDDLDALLKEEKRFDAIRATKIMRQVVSALEAAHTAPNGPVIHRDLKPANIRVSKKGREEHITVLDFGIAKAAEQPGHERLTQQGMVIGTPRYMAPEQACGDPVDARTDIYALGVIAYELVSGHTPYQTSRLVELINRQMHMPVPPLKADLQVPKAYEEIVQRCLRLEPKDRFATTSEMIEAFDRFLQDAAAATVRKRATAGIAAALVLGAAVAAGTYFLRGPGGPTRALALKALVADGRDVTHAAEIFVRSEQVKLEGTIEGISALAQLSPEVSATLGGKPIRARRLAEGFEADVGPLAPGKRAEVEVAVAYGPPERRSRAEVLRRTVFRDTSAPRLALRPVQGSPFKRGAEGACIFRSPQARFEVAIEEDGALAPEGAVKVRADAPLRALLAGTGGGSATVALDFSQMRPGEGALVAVRVEDAAGNASELEFSALFDPEPPELEVASVEGVESAAGGEYVVRASEQAPLPREVRVRVRAEDPSGIVKFGAEVVDRPAEGAGHVGGVERAAAPPGAGDGAAEALIALSVRQEGEYVFSLTAEDGAGNVATAVFALRCEVPLQVDLGLAEGETRYLSAADLAIEGSANKPLRAVEVSGAAATLSPDGMRFSARVPLAREQEQKVKVRIVPAAGEPITRSFTVVHDATPPAPAITSPAPWPDVISAAALEDGAIVFRISLDVVPDAPRPVAPGAARAVKAFGYRDEAAARRAEAEIAAEGFAGAGGGLELPVAHFGTDGVRVRPADAPFVVIGIEVSDAAGNVGRLARRVRVESNPPVVAAVPKVRRIMLHEPIVVEISTGKPVREVKVNGSSQGLRKTGEGTYVYEATMFLDSPLRYAVEAIDGAGNKGAGETEIQRSDKCQKPTDEEPQPVDGARLIEMKKKYPNLNTCPNGCGRPIFLK